MHSPHLQDSRQADVRPSLAPGFKFNGVRNLPATLTVNGVGVLPTLRYKGGDATAAVLPAWDYGSPLYITAGAAPTLNAGSPLLGADDDSVLFNNGASYLAGAANTGLGDIDSEDIAIEIISSIRTAGANQGLIGKRAPGGIGWLAFILNGMSLQLTLDDGAARVLVSAAISGREFAFFHAMAFVNRSENSLNGAQWYVNGFASGAGLNPFGLGSLINAAQRFNIGASNNGASNRCRRNVAYAALWLRNDWFQEGAAGPAEWAAVALARFHALTHAIPEVAWGTQAPVVATRASDGSLDKVEAGRRYVYAVAPGWPRTQYTWGLDGQRAIGYLAEEERTNILIRSNQMGSWLNEQSTDTQLQGDSPSRHSATGSNILIEANRVVETAVNNVHRMRSATLAGGVAVNDTIVYSHWLKEDDRRYALLSVNDNGLANEQAYAIFDLRDGGVEGIGNIGANLVVPLGAGTEDFGDGWYRCWLRAQYLRAAVAASRTRVWISSGPNVGDATYLGDPVGFPGGILTFGGQCELNVGCLSSYSETQAAAVTRTVDQTRYVGDLNIGGEDAQQGTVQARILIPDHTPLAAIPIVNISDGGAVADQIRLEVDIDGGLDMETAATAGNPGLAQVAGDCADGNVHDVQGIWMQDHVRAFRDDVAGVPDMQADIPDDLDRVAVGANLADNAVGVATVGDLKVFPRPKRTAVRKGSGFTRSSGGQGA